MKKKALVVAGGQWQVPLIKALQGKDYHVTVVDPYDNSKGVLIADNHIKCDVRDKDYIMSNITSDYDIVTTDQSDVSVDTVAYIAQNLKLPGNTLDSVRRFSNKYLSRRYARSIGVPVPDFCEVSSVSEMQRFIRGKKGDFIIKPCDAQSSKGIHQLNSSTSDVLMGDYLSDALSYSSVKKAILEQFVKGYEITVEGFCSDGKHQVMAISKKKHFKMGIASCLSYPADIPDDLRQRIVECDNLYVENSGLRFGPTHAEYIVNEQTNEFWLVEIACRGGGTLISSDIVKWVSGFDMQEALIQCLEGRHVNVKGIHPQRRAAELHFFDFGSGKVLSVAGVDEVRSMPEVLCMDFPIKVGDEIRTCTDDRSRQGFVIVLAETPMELSTVLKRIDETIKVEVQP